MGGSVETLLGLFGRSLVVFLLIANILVTAERLGGMVWLLTLGSMIPAAAVVKDYLSGDLAGARVHGYLSALTSNSNDVALTLNIVIALAVGLTLASPRRGHRVALAAAIALGVAGGVGGVVPGRRLFLLTTPPPS